MDNLTYWKKRKAQQMYEYMRTAEETAEELEEVYRKAAHHIQKEAKKVFEKYQTRYDLTRKEAEILLKQMKSPEDIRELKRLLKLEPKNEELLKELESQSYGFRLNNLSNLYGQLDAIVLPMIAAERQKTMRLYEKLAEEAYYQSVFDIQQYAGYGFDFKALDAKNIKKVLSTRWLGKNFSQRIWDNTHDLAAAVKKELLINLLTGRPLKKAQDAIMEKFEAGAGVARRLVRTESCYICNQMHLQGYEACGVKKYIYLAILDLKTSLTCRNLDKKRFPVAEAQVGKNFPPMHPWCRSTTLADMPDALLKKLKQSTIDPQTGQRITVPGDMTYHQWYEKYVKGKRVVEAQEKGLKNVSLDREQFEKYKEIFGDEIPETVEKFRDMKYNDIKKWERLKAEKQDRLNAMDFSQMQGLVGKLGNKESRLWYKSHIKQIENIIKELPTLEEQAQKAFNIRQQVREEARQLMKSQGTKAELPDRSGTFDDLFAKKVAKHPSWTKKEVLEDIIRSSQSSNSEYDRKAGIKK